VTTLLAMTNNKTQCDFSTKETARVLALRELIAPLHYIPCAERSLVYLPEGAGYLIETHYRLPGRPFRAVQPRDPVSLMFDMARFRGEQPALTPEWIEAACSSYVIAAEADGEPKS
jgi:hypothetical protein